jgi:hypothetical protein
VPNLDDAGFARIAGEAEKNCPVSKVLNAAITPGREARLVGRQEGDSVMARNHLPDQGAFRAVLAEEIDWQPFPAFPRGARLAVMVHHPAELDLTSCV